MSSHSRVGRAASADRDRPVRPGPRPLTAELAELVGAGRNGEAVEHFHQSIGVPPELIADMRGTPEWAKMESVAHTSCTTA
jgi:hypothetical protein